MIHRHLLVGALALSGVVTTGFSADYLIHSWKKIQLSDKFWGEGANFADFNKDGHMDIVSGPYWYEGPDFQKRHEYYPATHTSRIKQADGTEKEIEGFKGALSRENEYSDNFFAFTYDFNKDGWPDILIYGFPGKEATWFENPGRLGIGGNMPWKKHVVFDVVDNESPTWMDLTGDGKPEIICNSGGYFGYVTPDWSDTTKPWTFHKISPRIQVQNGMDNTKSPPEPKMVDLFQRFTHGLGVGDVNGDGRLDIMEARGWWEQPKSLAGDPEWKFHKVAFAPAGGSSHMFAYDVNGDGRNDVITCLAAHGYGLAWYEQLAEKDESGGPKFKEHVFMNKEPNENKYGINFSQLHAIDLVDMDGDGLKDIVTGKRFWAHGPTGDAEPNAPAVLYWFKLVRGADKSVDFVPYQIDNNSGVGTQVVTGFVGNKKYPDVVVGNKMGTFVHLHTAKKVSKAEWEAAQPKPYEAKQATK